MRTKFNSMHTRLKKIINIIVLLNLFSPSWAANMDSLMNELERIL